MKLNTMALANALAVLGAVYYLICYFVVLLAPDLFKAVYQSWAHGIDISAIWSPRGDNFFFGLVTFTVAAWVSGYAFAWVYNKLAK